MLMSRLASLVLNHGLLREHLSSAPIDFEEKPILMESLNELDIIVCEPFIHESTDRLDLIPGLSSPVRPTKYTLERRRVYPASLSTLLIVSPLHTQAKNMVAHRQRTDVTSTHSAHDSSFTFVFLLTPL